MLMSPDILNEALIKLSEFDFKERSGWLRQGRCPSCGEKELYTKADSPWSIKCGRLNNCGYEIPIKELYPDLFEHWSRRYPQTKESPTAAADAYLNISRGFDLSLIKGSYTQESFYDKDRKIGTATVRFAVGDTWWERLIDEPGRFEKKANFKYGGTYQGDWFVPPAVHVLEVRKLWIVEGIFDAIALTQAGTPAVAALTCNNYPGKALEQLREARKGQPPSLVWALDGDKAGRSYIRKWKDRAESEGWLCQAAVIPQGKTKRDWSDLLLLDRNQEDLEKHYLSQAGLDEYLYEGALLTAKTAAERGRLIFEKKGLNSFEFGFGNRQYWFDLDIEKYHRAIDRISEEKSDLDQEELREMAMRESGGIREIANCLPTPLYFQQNKITDESWYYFRVEFPHDGEPIKNTFTAGQLTTASEFKKRLLGIAPGAVYTGSNSMLERTMRHQLFGIKRVETIDFVGYAREFDTYVYKNVAVREGKVYRINEEDFFDVGKVSIKTLLKSVDVELNPDLKEYRSDWFQSFSAAFGVKGLAALTFFFGSLFAEQIRKEQDSYPFLEIVGEAGAGKTTLIEFLWRLLGRNHEGWDPAKASLAARARNLAQIANMPTVLIESDREQTGEGKAHVKSFDWDELKTAYNGGNLRSRGVANGGNDTYEPRFRGTIVIAQNNIVSASEAILSRIVHLYFDRAGQTRGSGAALDQIRHLTMDELSGFSLQAVLRAKEILEVVVSKTKEHQMALLDELGLKSIRVALNHAQLMALAEALQLIVPLSDIQLHELHEYFRLMAKQREQALSADHPLVQEFWEAYDYLNGSDPLAPRLNHSRDPGLIAINLNHFIQAAAEARQQIPAIRDLKKVLKTSRQHKFIDRRVVNSGIKERESQPTGTSTSMSCWVFSKQ